MDGNPKPHIPLEDYERHMSHQMVGLEIPNIPAILFLELTIMAIEYQLWSVSLGI